MIGAGLVRNFTQQISDVKAAVLAQLAAAAGATLVSFQSSGAGAAVRTLWAVLMDQPLSAKNFGAKGDNDADDTAALKAAITQAAALAKVLFLPAGTYKYSDVLNFGAISVRGEGPYASVLSATHAGIAVQINNPLPAVGDTLGQSYERFGITANAATTIGLRAMRCTYCSFKQIVILAPSTIAADYVGFRVSGAMYLNTFEGCVSDTIGAAAAAVGAGWWIGNGKNEVGNANADTNANTFTNCRGIRMAKGFDIDAARGCVMVGCDAETCPTAAFHVRGDYNKLIGPWVEAGSIVFDQYTAANGAGGFDAAVSPKNNYLSVTYPCDVTVNYAGDVTTIAGSRLGNLTIGANAFGVKTTGLIIGGALTNNGSDCDLEYSLGGNQYKVVQNGSSVVYRRDMLNGDTKLTLNGNQSIESTRFGALVLSSDNKFNFAGATPHFILNKTTDPGSSPANQAYFWMQDNGAGKLQLCVKFPSGVAQVLATQP